MALFESMLVLALIATIMLQVSRGLDVPYPAVLAVAGVLVAVFPWVPDIRFDPRLALALFITPALLDSAYDMPLRTLRRYWVPLVLLAAVAVLLTTAAVAWVGVVLAGLPVAAAMAIMVTGCLSTFLVLQLDEAYAAAKAGEIGLTRQLAHELGQFGITVNSVAPGFVRSNPTTERQWEAYGPEGQKRLIAGIALRRLGTVADITNAALFFASEQAGWISGQTLSVDGGK